MAKKIKIIIFIIFCIYLFFGKTQTYVEPQKWKIESKENETRIMVGRSLSYIKWNHSYEREGNDLYVKIFLVPYLNFLNNNAGSLYLFSIPEDLEEIEHIYTYDNTGNLVLVYPKLESSDSGDNINLNSF